MALLVAALLAGPAAESAEAHAGLVQSEPLADTTLGASPTEIRLTFSEQPEPSLSEILVLDAEGTPLQTGDPEPVDGDPLSLSVPVPQLPRGAYTVSYRAVSAVDGHATPGAFAFGVGVSPAGAIAEPPDEGPDTSLLEIVARWVLLVGLVALLGAAVASVARFGGTGDSDLRLAIAGWLLAAVGLILLGVAQRSAAGSSLDELLGTPIGAALIRRAIAIGVAGAALLLAWRRPPLRRGGLAAAGLAALAGVATHVDAGHAAASSWPAAVTVSAQVAHIGAVGVWFGGLAALLLGIRGEPSAVKAARVRRFAAFALAALIVVLVTGTLRAVDELASLDDLFTTAYGLAVLEKIALIALIVVLAARSRRRAVPAAGSDLTPLRRASRAELGLALAALAVAAVLGSLAPAVAGPGAPQPALSDDGSDPGDTVQVELEAGSADPGPNRFVVQVDDSETGEAVAADRVSLRFDPLDDPGVEETELELKPGSDGSYVGSGENLAFDGRWEVTVTIEQEGEAVEVPLELDLPVPKPPPSVLRQPGRPVKYDLQIGNDGYLRIAVDPQRAGPNEVQVTCYTVFQNLAATEQLVLTASAGDGAPEEQRVRRLGPSSFLAEVDLESGDNTLTMVAQIEGGIRLRGALDLEVPED